MIVVIDNYDSFTYNLVQYLAELGSEPRVVRNDAVDVPTLRSWLEDASPSGVLLGPGPGRPADAGITCEVVRALGGVAPLLGVCLGHQAIGEVFGGSIVRAAELMHGRTSAVEHDGRGVFAGLPSPLVATRYHSLVVDRASFPDAALEITARAPDGEIMGLRHRALPIEGVQFHPESFLTEHGHALLRTWLDACAVFSATGVA